MLLSVVIDKYINKLEFIDSLINKFSSFNENQIEFIITGDQHVNITDKIAQYRKKQHSIHLHNVLKPGDLLGHYYLYANELNTFLNFGINTIKKLLQYKKFDSIYFDFYIVHDCFIITSSKSLTIEACTPYNKIIKTKGRKRTSIYIDNPLIKIDCSNCEAYIINFLNHLYSQIEERLLQARELTRHNNRSQALEIYRSITIQFDNTIWSLFTLKNQILPFIDIYFQRALLEAEFYSYELAIHIVQTIISYGHHKKEYYDFLIDCYKKMGWYSLVNIYRQIFRENCCKAIAESTEENTA